MINGALMTTELSVFPVFPKYILPDVLPLPIFMFPPNCDAAMFKSELGVGTSNVLEFTTGLITPVLTLIKDIDFLYIIIYIYKHANYTE